jgi:hypothetical protein
MGGLARSTLLMKRSGHETRFCFFCWFGLATHDGTGAASLSRVRLQRPHDQIADQIADGHVAERSLTLQWLTKLEEANRNE